jgi:DNA repair and recombination protein RAD54B
VVIVSYFTETLDFIEAILNEHSITSSKLDGRVEGQDRFKTIDNFIREKTVLLLSGKAGGTGLTLTCASKMIMIEPDWNPSNDSQVMGRVWRQGQNKEVHIFRLLIGCSF